MARPILRALRLGRSSWRAGLMPRSATKEGGRSLEVYVSRPVVRLEVSRAAANRRERRRRRSAPTGVRSRSAAPWLPLVAPECTSTDSALRAMPPRRPGRSSEWRAPCPFPLAPSCRRRTRARRNSRPNEPVTTVSNRDESSWSTAGPADRLRNRETQRPSPRTMNRRHANHISRRSRSDEERMRKPTEQATGSHCA